MQSVGWAGARRRRLGFVLTEDAMEARPMRKSVAMAEPETTPPPQKLHWWSNPQTLLRYVLSLDDTAHHIALGTTMGMFIGLTPTVGIQMAIVIAVYYICLPFFRFNCKAAIVTVYISNPLTMVPLYWFDYRVGQLVFGGDDITTDRIREIVTYEGFAEWWRAIVTLFVDLGLPMFAGSLIVGSVGAAATYPTMRYLLRLFRNDSGRTAAKPEPIDPVAVAERRSA